MQMLSLYGQCALMTNLVGNVYNELQFPSMRNVFCSIVLAM